MSIFNESQKKLVKRSFSKFKIISVQTVKHEILLKHNEYNFLIGHSE